METFDLLRAEIDSVARVESLSVVDLMALPDPLRQAVTGFMRKGAFTVHDVCAELGLEKAQAEELAGLLLEKGYLRIEPDAAIHEITYRISLGPIRRRNIPLNL